MRTSDTERIKLTANLLNAIAAGIVITALIGPLAGMALGIVHPATDALNIAAFTLFGLVIAIVIHVAAHRVMQLLDKLR